jgi:hypothetical protein
MTAPDDDGKTLVALIVGAALIVSVFTGMKRMRPCAEPPAGNAQSTYGTPSWTGPHEGVRQTKQRIEGCRQ